MKSCNRAKQKWHVLPPGMSGKLRMTLIRWMALVSSMKPYGPDVSLKISCHMIGNFNPIGLVRGYSLFLACDYQRLWDVTNFSFWDHMLCFQVLISSHVRWIWGKSVRIVVLERPCSMPLTVHRTAPLIKDQNYLKGIDQKTCHRMPSIDVRWNAAWMGPPTSRAWCGISRQRSRRRPWYRISGQSSFCSS